MLHIVFRAFHDPQTFVLPSQSPSAGLGRHPRRMSPVFATGAVNTRHPTSWVSRSFRTNRFALSRSPYCTRYVAVSFDAETVVFRSRLHGTSELDCTTEYDALDWLLQPSLAFPAAGSVIRNLETSSGRLVQIFDGLGEKPQVQYHGTQAGSGANRSKTGKPRAR